MNKIMQTLIDILRDFFDEDDLAITEDTVASDVEGWDSLEHITLMCVIEDEFGIKFDLSKHLANVGELAREIEKLLEEKK